MSSEELRVAVILKGNLLAILALIVTDSSRFDVKGIAMIILL